MPDIGEDEMERNAARWGASKDAWMQTIRDMESIAEQRRDDGWDVVAIPAGDTATVSPDAGNDDRFGIVHVIADNHADPFTEAFERGEFPRYEAYRNEVDGLVFLVTELLDPETETAILLAGQYELRYVSGMVEAAKEEGVLYTHVQTLDKTPLGSFRHEEFDPLVPDADRIERRTSNRRSPAGDED